MYQFLIIIQMDVIQSIIGYVGLFLLAFVLIIFRRLIRDIITTIILSVFAFFLMTSDDNNANYVGYIIGLIVLIVIFFNLIKWLINK